LPKKVEVIFMGVIQEQYIIDSSGKKTAIILSMKQYKQLLEDLHDLAIVAERRDESVISLDEIKMRR
jgi:PHD/YefM family antitoxin component YafN of YafNO toxin-antitoxin module